MSCVKFLLMNSMTIYSFKTHAFFLRKPTFPTKWHICKESRKMHRKKGQIVLEMWSYIFPAFPVLNDTSRNEISFFNYTMRTTLHHFLWSVPETIYLHWSTFSTHLCKNLLAMQERWSRWHVNRKRSRRPLNSGGYIKFGGWNVQSTFGMYRC